MIEYSLFYPLKERERESRFGGFCRPHKKEKKKKEKDGGI